MEPITSTTTSSIGATTTISAGSTTTTSAPGSTTTTTVSGRLCPSKKVLGEESPQLENLRSFRDGKLAQSVLGRKAIEIYYNNADSINAALDRSPRLKEFTKNALEVIAPMLGRKEE